MKERGILLVDDELELLKASSLMLKSRGFSNVMTESDSRRVISFIKEHQHQVGVVVLDLYMPKLNGLDLLPDLILEYPTLPVVVMTAIDDAETAVNCMKSGAFDYLVKPVESGKLEAAVTRALEHSAIAQELDSLRTLFFRENLENPELFDSMLTVSTRMHKIFKYMEVVAATHYPILITGETGVGKELAARAIHHLSGRKGPFVAINVAGLDDILFSDTLFGHKKGAFTGAEAARDGLVAKAEGGTLFLDEIGDLSEQSQIKLLRLLQEKEYYPVGSDSCRTSTARILLATNQDLQGRIEEKLFRKDLFYRISAHRIDIPPLRERLEDLPCLLDHFLGAAAASCGKKKPTPPKELITLLANYSFPGNIRELEALVNDAVVRHTGGVLSMDVFAETITTGFQDSSAASEVEHNPEKIDAFFGHFPTISEIETYLIAEALRRSNGNQRLAASLLGMTRQTLNKRLRNSSE